MKEKKYKALNVRDNYSPEEAEGEINQILSAYPESVSFGYYEKEVNITNSYLVKSRQDRLRICAILSRCGVTRRTPENLAAEWLIHNWAYNIHFDRSSAVDVALDYVKDRRWEINAVSKIFEKLGIY